MVRYKLIYNRKNKLKKDGTGLIQLELYLNGKRKYYSTGIYVAPEYWDDKSERVFKSHPRYEEYNLTLLDLINTIEGTFRKAKLQEKVLSINDVLQTIDQAENSDLLIEFMKTEIEKDQRIKEKTKTDLYNSRNKIVEFNDQIRLKEIDYSFVVDYDNYLRSQGYSVNTIAKQHKNLKRFLNLAIKYKLINRENYPYQNFKVQRETKKREALSNAEVQQIEKLKFDPLSINDIVKDMFLFACYTGLRISDVTRLKTSHCSIEPQSTVLEFKSFKSRKNVFLPLHSLFTTEGKKSKPETVLFKYYDPNKELVFPSLYESVINRHIKEIAKQAGIRKNVTFHMGRHTFGTTLAALIPLPTLQSLMQHSDIKTTMIYVNMNQNMINDTLEKVNWKQ